MQLARHPPRTASGDARLATSPGSRGLGGVTGIFFAGAALLVAAPAWADDPPSDDDLADAATIGEVIVVTGTRSEAPLAASPVLTEVIDRAQLEASGVQTVADALALRPGLWVDRGVAGTSGITMQGLGPKYSLILVDGVRQIGRTDGYLDLDRFGLGDVEQIEIVRGPSSALYGTDALAGVVNIITRRPSEALAVGATSQIDHRQASVTRARVSAGVGGVAGALSGEYRAGPAVRRGDAASEATTLDSYDDRRIAARASGGRGRPWRIDGGAEYLYRDLRGVDASATGAMFDRRNLVETASAQLAGQYAGGATTLRVAGDASLYRDQYLHDQRASDALDTYEVTDEHLLETSAQLAHQRGQHRAILGGELLREALDSDRLSAPGVHTRGALYAQDEWRLGRDDQLLLVPAARVDLDSQFGVHAAPRLAARWQATPAVIARASVGLGYRGPSFKEQLLHFENPSVGYVVDGNPDLRPETSRSAQTGVEWRARPWLALSASAYLNVLRDLIHAVTLPDDGSGMLRFGYANIGRARTAGVEGAAIVSWGRAAIDLGYAFSHARDLDDDRPLEALPAQRVTAQLRWRDGARGFDAFAAAVLTGHRPFYLSDDPQQATRSARRYELRVRVAKRLLGGGAGASGASGASGTSGGTLRGFLGADNLLDAGDADLDRLPPRTFYAGVEIQR
jgi:outer membrane receptor for ferrienterochelin and colicins